jgi:predicted ATP-grasp superfamily ATP-dependent carboligase
VTRRALIVEDGEAPHVLAAARALSRAGWEVALAVTGAGRTRSRAVRSQHRLPAPEDGLDAFVAALAPVASGYDVVFGGDDIEVLALSAERDAIPSVVPHGAPADVRRAIDKLELVEAAGRAGIAAPRTRPATPEALQALDGPVMVKARLHWDPARRQDGRHALVVACDSRQEAADAAAAMRAGGFDPLLQDPVAGELMALSLVVDREGLPVAVSQQRTLRSSLRRTSCRAETVEVDPALLRAAVRLLGDLRWFGLANLQFLRPPRGVPHLIDLNGRFYGSLALAVAAGANLPDLWGRLALGDPVPSFTVARAGVRFQSFVEDAQRARAERRGGLLRDLAGCLAYAPGAAHPHADLRDPLPGAVVGGRMARRRVSPRRATA